MTPQLARAIRWFVLATAARKHRHTGNRHSTMLIHTSMLSTAHNRMRQPVEIYLAALRARWDNGDDSLVTELCEQWLAESARVPASTFGLSTDTWDDIAAHIGAVLAEIRVIIDNYTSSERLLYSSDGPPITAIVIGGNTLSRGLTLEGLVCSFFVRAASAYDTLLQMGRWFGYRTGYPDLTRIWMTEDLESWFFALATVEEEIRREIRRYEQLQLRPTDVPVRIRVHPAMAVTSAAKMRSAVPARVSFSQEREQTILFNHRDAAWLDHNIEATRRLFVGCLAEGARSEVTPDKRFVFRDVTSERIRAFLTDYWFHENAYRLRADLLVGYLDEQNDQGFLRQWNVVVMGHPRDVRGAIDLGFVDRVNLIERSRLDMPSIPYANIKSLVSTLDRVADLDVPREEIRRRLGSQPEDKRLAEYREDVLGDVGLLCVYPISKNSQPRDRSLAPPASKPRLPLNAVDDVIGLGIFFPRARGVVREHTYLSADLSGIERESDDADIAAIDYADEAVGEASAEAVP